MSGQEEQPSQNQNQNALNGDVNDVPDLIMLASSAELPNRRGHDLLDYIYGNGISFVPLRFGGGAFGGGGDGFHGLESSAASILARSLYDRCPVKRVISEEEHGQLVKKKFTSSMVEELKINGACGIWQVDFEEGDDIIILPCNHAFNAEAITKWLKEEKAECPICRFSFKSKEVVEREEGEGQRDVPAPAPAPVPAPADAHQENDIVRVNNIASRIAEHVHGQAHQHHHHHHLHHHHHSVSVPMNQLLRSVRMMSSSMRPQEPARAAVPSSSGAALPPSYAPVGQEARAEAVERDDVPPAHINAFNPNILNILNNINLRNIDINRFINNRIIINENIYPDLNSDEQEQADIEEAIRRSLE
jgi:hypothetical protein